VSILCLHVGIAVVLGNSRAVCRPQQQRQQQHVNFQVVSNDEDPKVACSPAI
jgi:hypothetical protein